MSAARRRAVSASAASAAGSGCGTTAGGAAALGRRAPLVTAALASGLLATAVLGDDIDVVSLLDDLVLAQLETPVADELAGLEVVLVAVPGADEMHLVVGEVEPARRLVGHDPLFHLGDDQAFARRSALVQADVAVGVELALVLEHPDLAVTDEDDAAIAVLDFRSLADELFGHPSPTLLVSALVPSLGPERHALPRLYSTIGRR